MGDDLTTLLGEVERAMLLDIEVAARPGISIHQARRNLDAFQDAAAGFLHTSQRVDVLAFLAWLEAAAAEENGLDAAAPEVNHEAVQLLTVHASKGLEWDVVFVPGLNAGAFPSSRDSRWSSGSAALPWPLRGDRADLPQWDLDQPDQKGWLDAEKDFKSAVQAHGEAEERRLAYVAYTRAKHVLWVSSAAWVGSRAGLADMSPFLAELEVLSAAGRGRDPPALRRRGRPAGGKPADLGAGAGAVALRSRWRGPSIPRTGARLRLVPGRRAAMEAAAARVLEQLEARRPPAPGCQAGRRGTCSLGRRAPASAGARQLRGPAAGWAQEAATLLDRRSRRSAVPGRPPAGPHFRVHPGGPGRRPASVVARLRRPVPREPGMSARKGTAFHAWVEEYFGTSGMLDLGEAAGSDDHIDEAYGLDAMVETFRRSEWAHRAPAHVEVPVETRIGDVVVRGRIDAVFRDADGGWDLVDWKTGRRPSARPAQDQGRAAGRLPAGVVPAQGCPARGRPGGVLLRGGQRRWSARTTWAPRNGWRRSSPRPWAGRRSAAAVRTALAGTTVSAVVEVSSRRGAAFGGADVAGVRRPLRRRSALVAGPRVVGAGAVPRRRPRAVASADVATGAAGVDPRRLRGFVAGDRRDVDAAGSAAAGRGGSVAAGAAAGSAVRARSGTDTGDGGLRQRFDADRLSAMFRDVLGQHRQHRLGLADHVRVSRPRGP